MRPLSYEDPIKGIIPKFHHSDPLIPTFHNCIRCLRQYKILYPYRVCDPINRDFCDECISELSYEKRQDFLMEMEDKQNISTGTLTPVSDGTFPLYP